MLVWKHASISCILTVTRSVWPGDGGVVQQPVFTTPCICQAELDLNEEIGVKKGYTEMTMWIRLIFAGHTGAS